jgi:hypothetical protein
MSYRLTVMDIDEPDTAKQIQQITKVLYTSNSRQ